jgi:predicted O-methyltransferase YrrM
MVRQAEIDAYLHKVTPSRDKILAAMERYARKNGFPIIGPLVGRFLYQMALVTKARKILELGSGFGYSAYWFAKAMGQSGRITMIDGDESNRIRAMKYFAQANLESRFRYIVGDALEVASDLKGPYDLILNDIDKHEYPDVIDVAARLLRPRGLFITDNIIWSGRVLDTGRRDRDTRGIRRFTKMIYNDRRFFTTIMPVRDGITVAVRMEDSG